MKTILKLVLVCFLCLLSIGILYIGGLLVYNGLTGFKPEKTENLKFAPNNKTALSSVKNFSILSWNLGYAGLGKEMDFFYEGGTKVRPKQEWNTKYLDGITSFVVGNDSIDFMLFQEIDRNAKRSYQVDQFARMQEKLPGFTGVFATNYKAAYVPVPWSEPMGKVWGGMATYSKYSPAAAVRLATPGSYSWPTRLFMLKRCLVKTIFPLDNGKQLVIYNVHNSAFDDASDLRAAELEFIRNELVSEYKAGNFVIAGGDWNQNPPSLDITRIEKYVSKELWPIPPEYFPKGWQWVYDPAHPTNRDVDQAFDPEKTSCTIIDFFLLSPNIEKLDIKTMDLEFLNSDHLPIMMTFKLDH